MKAKLIYKSEISGELEIVDTTIHNEYEATRIMDQLIETSSTKLTIVKELTGDIVRIPVYKHVKEGNRYSIYKLVGLETE